MVQSRAKASSSFPITVLVITVGLPLGFRIRFFYGVFLSARFELHIAMVYEDLCNLASKLPFLVLNFLEVFHRTKKTELINRIGAPFR